MQRSPNPGTLKFSVPEISSRYSLDCHYTTLPADQLLTSDKVLAVVSSDANHVQNDDPRHVHCGLTVLSQPALNEVWSTSSPVMRGKDAGLHWSQSEEVLFLSLNVDESACENQREAIYRSYSALLSLATNMGYPDIIRVWNYMPRINEGDDDAERYRQFCLGRQQAFAESTCVAETFPSACALGHDGELTAIYLLAGSKGAVHIENPRQQSAYNYPRQYGPASPSFARASLSHWSDCSHLYISGTASILGHESHHPNDLQGQLQTTFDNIDALLAQSASKVGVANLPQLSLLKIYIRNAADYPMVEQKVRWRYPGIPVLYMRADICRRELLVEIDGMCNLGTLLAVSTDTQSQGA